jgi:tetratricopeptide (TPR) repeat protein
VLLQEQGDPDGAVAAYRTAIDSRHAAYAPAAAFGLGVLLQEQGDQDGAAIAYQTAIDSHHSQQAPKAAVNLGLLLARRGDLEGAGAAYRTAFDSGDETVAPFAELLMGEYCTEDGPQARLEHRKRAAASGNPDVLLSIAELYLAEGAIPEGRRLLMDAAGAGSTVAGHCLQLFPQETADSADDQALQAVLASAEAGNTDSMNMLGLHAAACGDLEHAGSWWTRSVAQNDVIAPLLLSRHHHPKE